MAKPGRVQVTFTTPILPTPKVDPRAGLDALAIKARGLAKTCPRPESDFWNELAEGIDRAAARGRKRLAG